MSNFKQYLTPIAVVIAGLIIAGSIYLSGGISQDYADQPVVDSKEEVRQKEEQKEAAVEGKEFTISEEDHIRGDEDAPVTIVEYSDLECPYCQSFHPTVKKALEEYPEKVRWVYRHFPLDQLHSEARPAAEASECAGEQDKFWEFVDTMFNNQNQLGEDFYSQTAQDLDLDIDQFEKCVSSRKYKDKVQQDFQSGQEVGVRGTPGTFVNGVEVKGAVPYSQLQTQIEQALSELD